MAVMGVAKVPMAMLVRGFGRIARLIRSVRVLAHPQIFYAYERRCAAAPCLITQFDTALSRFR
jgi:hypothetical protein